MDACFVNTQPVPPELIIKYREKGAQPVEMDLAMIREKGYEIIEGDILSTDGQVRHDPDRLARLVFDHYFKMTKLSKV